MDLSFSRFEADLTVTALPPDLAVLMVGVAARQAASPTALVQAHLPAAAHRDDWFAPSHGSFDQVVARTLRDQWIDLSIQMKPLFTEPL